MIKETVNQYRGTEWELYFYIYFGTVFTLLLFTYVFLPPSESVGRVIFKTILRVGIYMFIGIGIHRIYKKLVQ